MRELFSRIWKPGANVTNSAQMFFALGGENVDRVGWNALRLLDRELCLANHVLKVGYRIALRFAVDRALRSQQ